MNQGHIQCNAGHVRSQSSSLRELRESLRPPLAPHLNHSKVHMGGGRSGIADEDGAEVPLGRGQLVLPERRLPLLKQYRRILPAVLPHGPCWPLSAAGKSKLRPPTSSGSE